MKNKKYKFKRRYDEILVHTVDEEEPKKSHHSGGGREKKDANKNLEESSHLFT